MLEETLESPLDSKEIQPVHPKGKQSWIFIGRTDAEAETPILWPPNAKNWLTWKDPDAGKDWRQEEKGTTEDEMFGWHHQLNGHVFEQSLTVGDGQEGLECCSPWGHKKLDRTEPLNWTELIVSLIAHLCLRAGICKWLASGVCLQELIESQCKWGHFPEQKTLTCRNLVGTGVF